MPIHLRVIPEWKHFAPRLAKIIQEKEHQSAGLDQDDKKDPLLLDVEPRTQFHCSCAASSHLQCITTYTGHSGNVVLGFQWDHNTLKHQIDMWVDDGQGDLRHHCTTPVYGRYKIQRMLFIPSQRVLVGYCNDMGLRVFTDSTQEMVVLYHTQCPAPVVSMHYCPQTNELLTGSMGLIAFWGFWTSAQTPLRLLRVLDWTSGSLQRDTVVSAFVSQRQTNSIYALCNRNIKNFEETGKNELLEFRGQSYARLRCVAAEWRQRYLYTGDAGGFVQVWSCDLRRLFLQFRAHFTAVTAVVLLEESGSFLTASTGCWIKQWTRRGDLLLKLHTDMAGGVQSMWKLSKNTIMCQSTTSLDVWRLNNIYKAFNDTACGVRLLRQMPCGRRKSRILAVTLDGIIRFLSPVTGELLLLSWPFLHIDKATGFAYDPSQEELYVCDGSVEVLVLNTSLSPCPVKQVLNSMRDGHDGVLCLETVMVWRSGEGGGGAGDDGPLCLVFSGHLGGKLQLLAPFSLHCEPQRAHSGAICQMSSISRKTPSICCYGTDWQFTVWTITLEGCKVDVGLERQIGCHFTPVHSRLMQGFICAVSPQQNLFFYSVHGDTCTESERKKSGTITCLDYCPQLDILALSGQSGKIEIWSSGGDMVAEIQLGVPVTQVCFGNARGDILASFADSISSIAAAHFLPARYLRTVLEQAPADDIIELPIPFCPKSPSHYNICLVPKIHLKCLKVENVAIRPAPDPATPESLPEENDPTDVQEEQNRKCAVRPPPSAGWRQTADRNSQSTALNSQPGSEPHPDEESDILHEALISMRSEDDFLLFLSHIAPDGYIPNSVVRAVHFEEDEEEEADKIQPIALLRDFEESEDVSKHTQAIQDILTRAKITRMLNAQQQTLKAETADHEDRLADESDAVLEDKEQHVMQIAHTLLGYLDQHCREIYIKYSKKLLALLRKQRVEKSLSDRMKEKFMSHVLDSSLPWRQLEAMRNLHGFGLLDHNDIAVAVTFLISPDPEFRALTRKILHDVFQIKEKQALRNVLQKTASITALEQLLDKLSGSLELILGEDHEEIAHKTSRQLMHSKDVKRSRRNRNFSLKPKEEAEDEDEQISSHDKEPQKGPKASSEMHRSTEASEEEQETLAEEEAKLTPPQAGSFRRTRRSVFPIPELTRKKERAGKPHSKQTKLHGSLRPERSRTDALLYAFRRALQYGSSALPHAAGLQHDLLLLPSDSGLGSLVSQDVSSDQMPTSSSATFLPISKPNKLLLKSHDFSQHAQSISQHPQHISQHPQHISQHAQSISQHPQHISQHPQHISQHPHYISQHAQYISQHAQHISQHPQHISQHAQHVSQHPHYISQHAQHVSQHAQYISQHAQHVSWHPQHISQHAELLHRPGDVCPNWRESLHQLIVLYGFRSRKAANEAASLGVPQLQARARPLPPLGCGPGWQGALGERVTWRTEMTDMCPPSPRFQHQLPLPWRLSHLPLSPQGQVKYGKLEVDWVRGHDVWLCQSGRLKLPHISPKGST